MCIYIHICICTYVRTCVYNTKRVFTCAYIHTHMTRCHLCLHTHYTYGTTRPNPRRHFRALSPSPTINVNSSVPPLKLMDMLISLGEGESAFCNYVMESTMQQEFYFDLYCTTCVHTHDFTCDSLRHTGVHTTDQADSWSEGRRL